MPPLHLVNHRVSVNVAERGAQTHVEEGVNLGRVVDYKNGLHRGSSVPRRGDRSAVHHQRRVAAAGDVPGRHGAARGGVHGVVRRAGTARVSVAVDRDCELKSADEQKSVVRYARHTLDIDEVGQHIAAGKVPTQLALTWNDRLSFVLTEAAQIKKIQLLDVVLDGVDKPGKDDDGFDTDAAIITTAATDTMSRIEMLATRPRRASSRNRSASASSARSIPRRKR